MRVSRRAALLLADLSRAEYLLRPGGRGAPAGDFSQYRTNPAGYCRDVLRVTLSPAQEELARLLLVPPYKVLAPSGHNVGKSFLAACLVCWRFDCFRPGVTLTTAPTDRQVKDILWKEVRRLRGRAGLGGFAGPKICRLEGGPGHFAHGFTARDAASFQGQHETSVFIVFDEAEGVAGGFWESAQTMLGPVDPFFAIYNPIRQDSQAYVEEQAAGYHVVPMSTVDHPNIRAELAGQSAPYPGAIRLARLRELLAKWAVPLTDPEEKKPTDVCVGSEWWRPGPVAESRLLGRRPSQAVNSVWGEWAWRQACGMALPTTGPLQVGCDVARYGDDFTAIHVRKGGVSLHHETGNGWSVVQTATRLTQTASAQAGRHGLRPQEVPLAVDDCGVGGGVTDLLRAGGWNATGVNVGRAPDSLKDEYPNLRSALWFGLAEAASSRSLSLSPLPLETRARLWGELGPVTYTLDLRGRRVVESKEVTKARLGRSPDNADAMMLAYCNLSSVPDRVVGRIQVPS